MKLETTTKMASTVELMHLCRLCLVKEQVNVPIFEDHERDSQIFLKIVTCLPVKINKDDKLPKNICGGCSYKLDLFYQFCNSTTNAEKQLLQWFNKVGFADVDNVDNQVEAPKDIVDEAQVDSMSTETQSYILQQQQLPYGPVEFFQGDFDDSQPASVASESEIIEETVSKKRKHPTNNVPNKKSKRVVTTKTEGSDDEDDDANDTNVIPFEDSKFSLSCERDGEQAGPSGIGKADATLPDPTLDLYKKYERVYGLRKCVVLLGDIENIDKTKYSLVKPKRKMLVSLNHVNILDSPRTKYKCSNCNERFQDYQILQSHKDVCVQKNDVDEVDEHDAYNYKYHTRLRSSSSSTAKTISQEAITTNTITTTSEATTTNTTTAEASASATDAAPDKMDSDEKKYFCKCGKHFSTANTLNAHAKICRVFAMTKNSEHLQCMDCHKFVYSQLFHSHKCVPPPKWNCSDCVLDFKSFYELVQHYKDNKHSMTCNMCLKECTSYGSLAAHKMSCVQKYAAKITFAITSSTTTAITTVNNLVLSGAQSSNNTNKVQQETQLSAETKTTTSYKTKVCTSGQTKGKTSNTCNVVSASDEKPRKQTCEASSTAATTNTIKCDLCSVRLPPEALKGHIESHFSIVQVKNVAGPSLESNTQETPNAQEDKNGDAESGLLLSELHNGITPADVKNQKVKTKSWKCGICTKIETTEKKLIDHMSEHLPSFLAKPKNGDNAPKAKSNPQTSSAFHKVKPSVEVVPPPATAKNSTIQTTLPQHKMVPLMNNQNQAKLYLIMTPTANLNLMKQNSFAMQPQLNLSTIPTTAQMPIKMQVTPSKVQQPRANGISNFVISDVTSGPAAQSMIEQQSSSIAADPAEAEDSSGDSANADSIDVAAAASNNDVDEDFDVEKNGDINVEKNDDMEVESFLLPYHNDIVEKGDDLTENAIDPNFKPKIFVKPLSQLLKSPVKMVVNEAVNTENEEQNVNVGVVNTMTDTNVIKQAVPEAEGTEANVVMQGEPQMLEKPPIVKTIIEVVKPSLSTVMPRVIQTTKTKFYRCSVCNTLQRKSTKVELHQRKFTCKVCPYYCCKGALMEKHYKDVHNYKNRCSLCDGQFQSQKLRQLHRKEVHTCPRCDRIFPDLLQHPLAHQCNSCEYYTCSNELLDDHYKKTHCVMMRCTPCKEMFYSVTTFTNHKDNIHYCKKCKTYKMDLNIHQSFCKGVPSSSNNLSPILNTQVIVNNGTTSTDVIEVDSD